MQQTSASRKTLLAVKAQIALAEHGCRVLQEKRNALLRELSQIMPQVLDQSQLLQNAVSKASLTLLQAQSLDGPEALRSAAIVAQRDVSLQFESRQVMGLLAPVVRETTVSRPLLSRGFAVTGTPLRLHEVAKDYERVMDRLIAIAAIEVRARRIAREIRKTNRRANALEYILIPSLNTLQRRVKTLLNEREREDTFRLITIAKRKGYFV